MVPAANGKSGMNTPFIATVTLMNHNGIVRGDLGSSGTATAEVYFEMPDGTRSNIVNLSAL